LPEELIGFDRLLVLDKGKIVLDDEPVNILSKVEDLSKLGLAVPVEFEINHYLKKASGNKISLNTSDFLPIF
jgi:ABC-type multidrug transport system ATPase subunit